MMAGLLDRIGELELADTTPLQDGETCVLRLVAP